MKWTLFFCLFFSAHFSFAQTEAKSLATEMTVMTRSMDLLFAREEMKESLPSRVLRSAVHMTINGSASSEVDRKVALLTDNQGLEGCQIAHSETKSADGSTTDALVEYKGADCPFAITATIHLAMNGSGADGTVNLEVEILSAKILTEIDLKKLSLPMKVHIQAAPGEQGFVMDSQMSIAAILQSQKLGTVNYTADILSHLLFGQSIEAKTSTTETYTGTNLNFKFLVLTESNNNEQKETYFFNDQEVSKEEYNQKHASVAMPGFDDKPTPLAKTEMCLVRAYNSSIYSLETVRKNISENTAESLKTSEEFSPVLLMQTGKMTMPVTLSSQALDLTVDTTPDASRFSFEKNNNGAPSEVLGKITAVHGDKVDLTKLILDRVVRITCTLK